MLIFILKAFALLPFSWQRGFAKFLLPVGLRLVKRRVRISEINLRKCFPSWSEKEVKAMARKSFESFLLGAVEGNAAWNMSPRRWAKIPITMKGVENFNKAKARGGIILCGFHFHTLEITGRTIGETLPGTGVVYQKHPNPKFDAFLKEKRGKYAAQVFRRKELKSMLKWLKDGNAFWYAPDQDFGEGPSVYAPFFGIQTATISAPARMAQRTGASLVPVTYFRTGKGFEVEVLPALDDYPSGDEVKDAARLNALFEKIIMKHPEQYLWQHRRFKTRPKGEASFY